MSTETTGQQAKKSFVITMDGELSADQLQADLNAWLQERKATISPAPTAEVRRLLNAGYIDDVEAKSTIELLQAYADTADTQQNLLRLFHDLVTDNGEEDIRSGFWNLHAFIHTLTRFFLLPGNADAYKEQVGGISDLSTHLPDLLEFFANLGNSYQAVALLEAEEYRRHWMSIREPYNENIVLRFSSKLQAHKLEHQLSTKAA